MSQMDANRRPARPTRRRLNAPARRAAIVPEGPPQDEPRDGYTAVGRVARSHGLKGELRVAAFAAGAPNLRPGRRPLLGGIPVLITGSRPNGEAWIIATDALRDRTEAEAFRGQLLEVPDGEVEREAADSYFIHELIGLRVITEDGEELGVLSEVLQPGANDVYVVTGPRGEVLVPAIADVVTSIDLPVGVMVITPPPGLLDGSA
jgi:16S rRNA processing protein RimM